MATSKIVIYQDRKRQWRWRCVAGNGEPLSKGVRGHKLRESVEGELKAIKAHGQGEQYPDKRGKARWRLTIPAGDDRAIGAVSSQGYVSSSDASHALALTKAAISAV
jgi:uncharacterized protein YegP (UPF0339 family)